ncbi:TPA: hypothetical protein NJ626_000242 [Vibrio parahaemolyticus]|uniref:hypothetical protein n=1 Tax=Vibrio parahaemolyticus TaxID=670 RepID=UPI00301D54A0|nr:hypothetical protein [Vibrio parahaemolyticus]HCM1516414.1 hypothetical protein [Vibrio parahaemolyticus]
MVYWGLTYEEFHQQPLTLINRLYLLNLSKPFLPSSSWVRTGTAVAATYNVHAGKKGKTLSHEDIFPFLKTTQEVDIMEGVDEDSQRELHNKIGAIFG